MFFGKRNLVLYLEKLSFFYALPSFQRDMYQRVTHSYLNGSAETVNCLTIGVGDQEEV